jgi:hypothetical protein
MVRRALRVALLRALIACAALTVTTTVTLTVEACPNCAAGREARSEVWSGDFVFNFFVSVVPFLLIGAICVCAEAIGRRSSSGHHESGIASRTGHVLEPDRERLTRERADR